MRTENRILNDDVYLSQKFGEVKKKESTEKEKRKQKKAKKCTGTKKKKIIISWRQLNLSKSISLK